MSHDLRVDVVDRLFSKLALKSQFLVQKMPMIFVRVFRSRYFSYNNDWYEKCLQKEVKQRQNNPSRHSRSFFLGLVSSLSIIVMYISLYMFSSVVISVVIFIERLGKALFPSTVISMAFRFNYIINFFISCPSNLLGSSHISFVAVLISHKFCSLSKILRRRGLTFR